MPSLVARRANRLAAAAIVAMSMGGCAAGDVEINGSIFDYLGVSSKTAGSTLAETKVPQRTGLVLPPNAERLPEPGSGAMATASVGDMPVDPEARKVGDAAAAEKHHEKVCADLLWKAKVAGTLDKEVIRGPLGVCNQSILNGVQTNTGFDTSKQGVDPTAKFATKGTGG